MLYSTDNSQNYYTEQEINEIRKNNNEIRKEIERLREIAERDVPYNEIKRDPQKYSNAAAHEHNSNIIQSNTKTMEQ